MCNNPILCQNVSHTWELRDKSIILCSTLKILSSKRNVKPHKIFWNVKFAWCIAELLHLFPSAHVSPPQVCHHLQLHHLNFCLYKVCVTLIYFFSQVNLIPNSYSSFFLCCTTHHRCINYNFTSMIESCFQWSRSFLDAVFWLCQLRSGLSIISSGAINMSVLVIRVQNLQWGLPLVWFFGHFLVKMLRSCWFFSLWCVDRQMLIKWRELIFIDLLL